MARNHPPKRKPDYSKVYLSTGTIAGLLQLSESIIRRFIDEGSMPGHLIPGSKRHRRAHINDVRIFAVKHGIELVNDHYPRVGETHGTVEVKAKEEGTVVGGTGEGGDNPEPTGTVPQLS